MKIKSFAFAVASTLSITALANNASVDSPEIQKAIQLLEEKGYQIDSPSESRKSSPSGVQLKTYQAGKIDAFFSGAYGRAKYKGGADLSSDSTTMRDNSYNLRGSFAYQDPSKLGFQFDAVYSQDDMKKAKMTTLDLAGHAFYRNDKFLLGLFGQYKQPKLHNKDVFTGSAIEDFSANSLINMLSKSFVTDQAFFGAEAQGYFGDLTLTGQVARQNFINKGDSSADLSGDIYRRGSVASTKADYFVNDNWKLTGGYSFNNVDGVLSYDTKKYALGTEYRLNNYPVSFYADYNRNKLSLDGDGFNGSKFNTDAVMLGIRWNFGSDSLKSRNRSGASLDPISNMGFANLWGQALGATNNIDLSTP
jgi:hypothetical protein